MLCEVGVAPLRGRDQSVLKIYVKYSRIKVKIHLDIITTDQQTVITVRTTNVFYQNTVLLQQQSTIMCVEDHYLETVDNDT